MLGLIFLLSRVVRASRSIASPNPGFLRQLEEFQVSGVEDERRKLGSKYIDSR